MESKYWIDKWIAGDTRFHMSQPHPQLVKFHSHLPKGKIMVPLCGKSPDLLWLKQQGHTVVGVELSELACRDFFAENKLEYQTHDTGKHLLFKSEGIEIWCGDFFEVPESAWNGCTSVYDRAALIALPPQMRHRYAQTLLRNWPASRDQTLLVIAISYPSLPSDGPPFSVPEIEIRSLYDNAFNTRLLAQRHDQELSERFRGGEVIESTYLLTKKTG